MSDTVETWTSDDGQYRIRIEYDNDYSVAEARSFDMVAEVVHTHPRHNWGDRGPDYQEQAALERGGWRLLVRYLRLVRKALVVVPVGMYEHSGITIYPMSGPDEFVGTDTAWDHSTAGFAYVTAERFEEMSGGDPDRLVEVSPELVNYVPALRIDRSLGKDVSKLPVVWQNVYAELQEIDDVLTGDVYGYVIEKRETWQKVGDEDETRDEWETVDSCWGFVGESKYCMAEAKAALPAEAREKVPA